MPAAPTKAEAPASTLASLRQSITTLQLHPTLAPLVLLALVGARTSPDAAARGCVIRLPAEASSTDVASVTTALRNICRCLLDVRCHIVPPTQPAKSPSHNAADAFARRCFLADENNEAAEAWLSSPEVRKAPGRRRSERTASPSHDLPDVLILPHLDREAPSAQRALMQALRDRKFSLQPRGHDDGGIFPLPKTMVPIAVVRGEPSNVDPLTIWGLSRHLIDRFALSYTCTAVDVAALNEQPGQLASTPLFRAHIDELIAFARSFEPSHQVGIYAADLVSALRVQPSTDARMLGNRAELTRWASIWASLGASVGDGHRSRSHEVPLQAIRDVFRSVVGHRTVVRPPDAQLARFWCDYVDRDQKLSAEAPLAPSVDEAIDVVLYNV